MPAGEVFYHDRLRRLALAIHYQRHRMRACFSTRVERRRSSCVDCRLDLAIAAERSANDLGDKFILPYRPVLSLKLNARSENRLPPY